MKIYLAGPLFTQAERRWNVELAAAIEARNADLHVIVPQEMELPIKDGKLDFAEIFARNVEILEGSDLVVAILDGADSDSGTAWECGYAYAKSIPIVGVRTDFRKHEDEYLNLMLSRSCVLVAHESFDESIDALAIKIVESIEGLAA